MVYRTSFEGSFLLDKPLQQKYRAYLKKFSQTRRVKCFAEQLATYPDPLREAVGLPVGPEGAYFVGKNLGYEDPVVFEDDTSRFLVPPQSQPGFWCKWTPTEDGTAIVHNGHGDFYFYVEWLQYLLVHFLIPWGYTLNGTVYWRGSDEHDYGCVVVEQNTVTVRTRSPEDGQRESAPQHPVSCAHKDAYETHDICSHLLAIEPSAVDYHRWFTGNGYESYLICEQCHARLETVKHDITLCHICKRCFREIEENGSFSGIIGQPESKERATALSIFRETVTLPIGERILALQPVNALRESVWVALTADGKLLRIDLTGKTVAQLIYLPPSELDLTQEVMLHLAPDGQLAAVVNTHGQDGLVVDMSTGQTLLKLRRGHDYIAQSPFPIAFFVDNGRTLLVHGTEWNRLDISDPRSGELLTPRLTPQHERGKPLPSHYLDYFHCSLAISPDQQWIIDNGWVWQPVGCITAWNLQTWLHENVWESEDGAIQKVLCMRDGFWNGPLCWVDQHVLAVWGYGDAGEWMVPAVRLFDVASVVELRWFAGPKGSLAFDTYLFSFSSDDALAVWDVETGVRLLYVADFRPTHYHHGAHQFLMPGEDGTFIVGSLQ